MNLTQANVKAIALKLSELMKSEETPEAAVSNDDYDEGVQVMNDPRLKASFEAQDAIIKRIGAAGSCQHKIFVGKYGTSRTNVSGEALEVIDRFIKGRLKSKYDIRM
tara:strand:- start:129 stop:449 length:321 start_codon:yes stop_codon:yes gene_type:complete